MEEPAPGNKAPDAAPAAAPETPALSDLKKAQRAALLSSLADLPPISRAEAFLQLPGRERKQVLRAATPSLAAALLADCDSAALTALLGEIKAKDLAPALRLIAPDDLADLALRLETAKADEVLEQVDGETREQVKRLMSFDPESAGGMMTPRYVSVPDVANVTKALDLLRGAGAAPSSSYIYLVDAGGRLTGVVPLRRIVLAAPKDAVRDLAVPAAERLRTSTPAADVLAAFERRPLLSLPVVDEKDRLVGIVTADDAVSARHRAEERVIRGVTGVDPREALRATVRAAAGRAPWLGATIAAGLAMAFVASVFHDVLSKIAVIGAFVPLVLSLADSVASQTIAVVFSAQASGSKGLKGLLWKELRVGLLVSAAGAVAVGLASIAWHRRIDLALLIGAAVVVSGTWAALLGALIPGFLKRAGLETDSAGGPLTLALADLSALVLYLGAAAGFLALRSS